MLLFLVFEKLKTFCTQVCYRVKIFSYHVKAVNDFLVLVGFSPFILDYEHFYAMQQPT